MKRRRMKEGLEGEEQKMKEIQGKRLSSSAFIINSLRPTAAVQMSYYAVVFNIEQPKLQFGGCSYTICSAYLGNNPAGSLDMNTSSSLTYCGPRPSKTSPTGIPEYCPTWQTFILLSAESWKRKILLKEFSTMSILLLGYTAYIHIKILRNTFGSPLVSFRNVLKHYFWHKRTGNSQQY